MQKYELCEVHNPIKSNTYFPERSRLFSLHPIGFGTGMCEGLISWITRLAALYRTTNEKLIRTILRENPQTKVNFSATHSYLRRSNGMNEWSLSLVRLLEQLTFRNDLLYLTALPYSQSISVMYLMRHHRSWCPACFDQWAQEEHTIFEPLFWTFSVSKVCPVHYIELEDTCYNCAKKMYPYYAKQQIGYCDYCKSWLGNSETKIHTLPVENYQFFAVNSLCNIIAQTPKTKSLPIKNRSKALFQKLAQEFTDGKKKTFSKMCKLNYTLINGYITGKYLPCLHHLINISYTVNIPITDLLYCNLENNALDFYSSAKINNHVLRPKRKSRKLDPELIETINVRLDNILLSGDSHVSIQQICKEYNISQPTFVKYFSTQRNKLIDLNKTLLAKEKEKRMNELIHNVQQITESLYNSGIYPSLRKVADKCIQMSFKQELRNVWKEKMIELNIVERVNKYQ
jgi:hypothetical protein